MSFIRRKDYFDPGDDFRRSPACAVDFDRVEFYRTQKGAGFHLKGSEARPQIWFVSNKARVYKPENPDDQWAVVDAIIRRLQARGLNGFAKDLEEKFLNSVE